MDKKGKSNINDIVVEELLKYNDVKTHNKYTVSNIFDRTKIKYVHDRNNYNKIGVITHFLDKDNIRYIGYSICSVSDKFNKIIGIRIAIRRMIKCIVTNKIHYINNYKGDENKSKMFHRFNDFDAILKKQILG